MNLKEQAAHIRNRFWRITAQLWRREGQHPGSKRHSAQRAVNFQRKRDRQSRRYARLCERGQKHRWTGRRP